MRLMAVDLLKDGLGQQRRIGFFYPCRNSVQCQARAADDLAGVIFSMGLDIRTTKVNSGGEKMTGVFCVRGSGGEKVYEPDLIEEARHRLMVVL